MLRIQDTQIDEKTTVEKSLLDIIKSLFVITTSKNALQVGLCALVRNLKTYPQLNYSFVKILLAQPTPLRRRILNEERSGDSDRGRISYVMGGASRHYEEICISTRWHNLSVAKTFANLVEDGKLEHLEQEHIEVCNATLPTKDFSEEEASEWLSVFDKVKAYAFVSLADPEMHSYGVQFVRKFWTSKIEKISNGSLDASAKTLVQTWQVLYGDMKRKKVDSKEMFHFLKEMQNAGKNVSDMLERSVDSFKENYPQEFSQSDLNDLFL